VKLGRKANRTNIHIELRPLLCSKSLCARLLLATDLPDFCKRDEALLREQMTIHIQETQTRVIIIPYLAHLGWHFAKEEFTCNYLFGKVPEVKRTIAGLRGSQVWLLCGSRSNYCLPPTCYGKVAQRGEVRRVLKSSRSSDTSSPS
jgi:hypothetical protein